MQANGDYKERTKAELTGNDSLLLGPGDVKSRHIETVWQPLSDSSVGWLVSALDRKISMPGYSSTILQEHSVQRSTYMYL